MDNYAYSVEPKRMQNIDTDVKKKKKKKWKGEGVNK